jgi:hypothetical protein
MERRIHGRFPHTLDKNCMDKEQLYWCLECGHMKGETECLIVATQNQTANTVLREKCWNKVIFNAVYVRNNNNKKNWPLNITVPHFGKK